MTAAETIAERLRALAPEFVAVRDDSAQHVGHREAGSGAHLHIRIVAACFAELPPLARHRLIYQTIGDLTAAGVHALAVAAFAPGETPEETQ